MKDTITIKLPKEEWGTFWKALVVSGEPVSCIEDGNTYVITPNQANLLKEKGVNFEAVSFVYRSKV
jgi:hypothetical protein